MDKLLYKITVIVLKILPMLLAFITEMTTSLMDSNEFDYSIFHIGNGKVTMSLFNQKIALTTSDIDLLKSMFNN